MYNEIQKEQYLSTIENENTQRAVQRIFNNATELEEQLQKDLCDFSKGEFTYFLETGTGTGAIDGDKCMLKAYVDWCISNGHTIRGINYLQNINSSDIDKRKVYQSKYLMDEHEFNNMLDNVFNQFTYYYNEEIDKPKELTVRLCYLGMENEEIVLLKKSDVDYENRIISSPLYIDIIYEASDIILELCRFCSMQEEVEYPGKHGMRKERLCNNEYLFRQRIGTLRGNPENRPLDKVIVNRRVKEFNDQYIKNTGLYKNITPDKLRQSALFHQFQKSNDKDKFFAGVRTDVLLRDPYILERQLSDKLRKIKKSYQTWTRAFEYPDFEFKQIRRLRNKKVQKQEPDIFERISKIVQDERKLKTITDEQWARNQHMVDLMKKHYGYRCQLCTFDNYFDIIMDDKYYVELHHIIPNAEGMDEEGSLDRPDNMIVVCPNHHRYLHYNLGGGYRLEKKDGIFYLDNGKDRLKVERDLHLFRYFDK